MSIDNTLGELAGLLSIIGITFSPMTFFMNASPLPVVTTVFFELSYYFTGEEKQRLQAGY